MVFPSREMVNIKALGDLSRRCFARKMALLRSIPEFLPGVFLQIGLANSACWNILYRLNAPIQGVEYGPAR